MLERENSRLPGAGGEYRLEGEFAEGGISAF
jgi:hypothetical protein